MWNVRTHRWEGRSDAPDEWDADDNAAKRDARLTAEFNTLTMTVDCWRCHGPVTVLVKDFIADRTIDHCAACYPSVGRRRSEGRGWT